MSLKIHILGCYAATPRSLSNPTSQVVEIKNQLFLIDCAEGTQVQLRKQQVKFSRINHVFISHLHGDHFFGLIGLISTFSLLNREKELHIHGPKGIKELMLLQLKLSESYTKYPLYFHELTSKEPEVILETDSYKVTTIPLNHRIYCNGFLLEEKLGERKLNIDAIRNYPIDQVYFSKIKQGKNMVLEDGTEIPNEELTFAPDPPKSYAYCSDTIFDETLAQRIPHVTVLYHESTFLEKEADLAEKTKHSTAKQAAMVAKQAGVQHLILGHYSTRYKSLEMFAEEAKTVFSSVHLADDGKVFEF